MHDYFNIFRKYGLSESLFERLQNPDATVTLNLNYRMNHTITKLANNFMYDGKLQVANEITGNAVLKIPNLQVGGSVKSFLESK